MFYIFRSRVEEMGFDFHFGEPKLSKQGKIEVYADFDFSNVFSIPSRFAELFFNLTSLHKQCFMLIRVGDIHARHACIVSVSPELKTIIHTLDESAGDDVFQAFTKAFKEAFRNGLALCQNNQMLIESY
jgi:hypothetical protein